MSMSLLDFVTRYGPNAGYKGPELYVSEVLGVETIDPWQIDTLQAYGDNARAIAIAAAHGPGKTALAAWLVNYQLDCVYPQLAAATAPSKGQMEDALLKEVHLWFKRRPDALQALFDTKAYRIELAASPGNSFFTAATARAEKPEALQGKHTGDGGRLLLIADEASGVDEAVFRSARGSMSQPNATTLLLSNPTRSSGYFYEAFHKAKDRWHTVTVSYKDSPRISEDFVNEVRDDEGEDSDEFRVRCLGLFPKTDQDTVISWELVDSAQQRDIEIVEGAESVWGLDVARFGDDKNALVKRSRRHVDPKILVWGGIDTMGTVGKVMDEWTETPVLERPDEILVDVIGLGAGVADRLRELGLPVRDVNVSETASANDKYFKVRDELWFECKRWLASAGTKLPLPDPDSDRNKDPVRQLARELTAPKYGFRSNGQRVVESKADMKKRGHKSPNVADALCLTFAGTAATMLHGSKGSTKWNEPLERGLAMV